MTSKVPSPLASAPPCGRQSDVSMNSVEPPTGSRSQGNCSAQTSSSELETMWALSHPERSMPGPSPLLVGSRHTYDPL